MSPEAATFPGVSDVSDVFHPIASSSGFETNLPTAVCDLATGLADYTRQKSARVRMFHGMAGKTGEAVKARVGQGIGVNNNIPLSEMTSRMFAICLWYVEGRRCGGGGEVAADSVGGGWVVRWRQRCSREVFTLPGPWGRSCCEVCCAERDSQRLA